MPDCSPSQPAPLREAGEDGAVFDAPWQAQAFALTVHLHERGLFEWGEWVEHFSAILKAEQLEDSSNDDYYRCWLKALEALLASKGLADGSTIEAVTNAWHRAARATPHGQPILLENDPKTPA